MRNGCFLVVTAEALAVMDVALARGRRRVITREVRPRAEIGAARE